MLQNFSVAVSVGPRVCFVLVLILISMFLEWCICGLGVVRAGQTAGSLGSRGGAGGRGLVSRGLVEAPRWFLLLAVPGRLFCFGSLVILDVARCYLWLFTLYINIKIIKIVVKC